MYFERRADSGLWGNWHYFKGLSRTMMAANVSRPVPAVTGACMMVERALYEQVGGLSDGYVDGGYEDSDFCIRLIDAGRHNWYMADVELFHLEAQSYPIDVSGRRRRTTRWLHTHLWDDRIEEIMRAQAEGSDAQSDARRVALRTFDVTEVGLLPERTERLLGFEVDLPQAGAQ